MPVFAFIFPLSTNDKTFPPPVFAGVSLVTNNGGRAPALGGQLSFKENTYLTTAGYARGNLDYNLYGLDSGGSQFQLPLKQTGPVVFAEFLRRIAWKVFLTKLTEIESETWHC